MLFYYYTASQEALQTYECLVDFREKGYTTLAPHYKGHGVEPEELITTGPADWWQDVVAAYKQLQDAGYQEIAVAGLSLGGVMALNVALNNPVKGIVTMCAPMTMRTTDVMFEGVLKYARDYKSSKGNRKSKLKLKLQVLLTKACHLYSNYENL